MKSRFFAPADSPRALEFTNDAYFTFVCLNKNGRPIRVPRLELEDDFDRACNRQAFLRQRLRRRLKAFLAKQNDPKEFTQALSKIQNWNVKLVVKGSVARAAHQLGIRSGQIVSI